MPHRNLAVDNRELVQRQFGSAAEAYATSHVHAKGASLKRLVDLVRPRPDWKVLDVATGGGHTAFVFAPKVAHVIATDITKEMLEKAAALARERAVTNVSFEVADAESLPFPDRSFDLVTCRIAAHHFPNVGRFVAESARVLMRGGLLAVVDNIVPLGVEASTYVNQFERLRDPSHARCLSADEWAQAFAKASIALVHTEAAPKSLDFNDWTERMNVPPAVKDELLRMLREAPPEASAFLKPSFKEDTVRFTLHEAILVGRAS